MPQNGVWGNVRLLDTWGEGRKKLIERFKRPCLPISKYCPVLLAPRKGEENLSSFLPFSVIYLTRHP